MDGKLLVSCLNKTGLFDNIHITIAQGKDSLFGLSLLVDIVNLNAGVLSFDKPEVIQDVVKRGKWNGVSHVIGMHKISSGNADSFALVAKYIQNIKLILRFDHPAKALFTSKQWKREEAIETIKMGVMSGRLMGFLDELHLDVSVGCIEFESIPTAEFVIKEQSGDLVSTVLVDSWSGRIAIDGVWSSGQSFEFDDIANAIELAVDDYALTV